MEYLWILDSLKKTIGTSRCVFMPEIFLVKELDIKLACLEIFTVMWKCSCRPKCVLDLDNDVFCALDLVDIADQI